MSKIQQNYMERTYLGSHQTADLRHVAHQNSLAFVGDPPKPRKVPIPRVGAAPTDQDLGPVIHGLLLQPFIVNVPSLRIHLVWQGLKEDRSGRHLLPTRRIVPMTQMPARRQVEPQNPIFGQQQRRVNGEVGRGAGVRLHIDTPPLGIQVEGFQGPLAAEQLDLVDELVAAVVAGAGHPLRVLVGEVAAEGVEDGAAHEVLRRDQLHPVELPLLLLIHDGLQLRVGVG